MSVLVNESQFHVWDLGTTGKTGTMTATLTRFPTTTTSEAGTETVSIAEIGATGIYTFQYTPTLAYNYLLQIAESTLFAETSFSDDVQDAASAATATGAYCSEANVVALVQIAPDYTVSTTPNETEVLTFMADRAAQIYAWMVAVAGSSAPGPSSYANPIDTSTDSGLALSRVCRMANALAAAADTLLSSGAGTQPARSERGVTYLQEYENFIEGIQRLVKTYVGVSGTLIATAYTAGEVTTGTVVSVKDRGLTFTGDTEW